MNTIIETYIDKNLGLVERDVVKISKDLGYEIQTGIDSAAELGKRISNHGPLILFNLDAGSERMLLGVRKGKVKIWNFATGLKEEKSFSKLKLSAPGNMVLGGNVPGKAYSGKKFTELQAPRDGVGHFHANHTIGYFRTNDLAAIKNDMFVKFVEVFNLENTAELERTENIHDSKPVLVFTADQLEGYLHSDFIALGPGASDNLYAITLKREWRTLGEKVVNGLGTVTDLLDVNPIDPEKWGYQVNSRHFLAGRRSWKFGKVDGETDLYFFETAAVERYSHVMIQLAEAMGRIKRETTEFVWASLLNNIGTQYGVHFEHRANVPNDYLMHVMGGTHFIYQREIISPTPHSFLHDPVFSEILDRHPELWLISWPR